MKTFYSTFIIIPKYTFVLMLTLLLIFSQATYANLEITEILPNPKGTDKGNEWIELFNPTKEKIDLNNYKINKKVLPNQTLLPNTHTTITNIPLKNTKETLTLTKNNKIISQITYENVQESKSYTKILINNCPTWIWAEPSNSLPNPTFRKLTGRITKPPIKNHFYFNNLKIYITKDFSLPLLKALFIENQQLEIIINTKKEIVSFKILQIPQAKNFLPKTHYFFLITLISTLSFFISILITTIHLTKK